MRRSTRVASRKSRLLALSAAAVSQALLAQFRGATAYAVPKGAQVVRGAVTITQSGDEMTIHASNNSIINFASFDIAQGETVDVIEPSARSRVLERVFGTSQTVIDGDLISNGRLFLVNPNGISFGQSASVNVAGLTAVAGLLSDSDFLNGANRFTHLTGSIVNQGQIVSTGPTALVGATVQNAGDISAGNSTVVVAAGANVFIGNHGSDIYATVTPQADSLAASVPGSGDIYSLALSRSSQIQAHQIVINGGGGGTQISGALDASSATSGGGSVTVASGGGNVQVAAATINASGSTGGGTVQIGGGPHGAGPLPAAANTSVSADSTISADAATTGNGGAVVVWSSDVTTFQGNISARGGSVSGNGGSAEVSGAQNLAFTGAVNLTAPNGLMGTLLLDPHDITVVTAGADSLDGSGNLLYVDGSGTDFNLDPSTLTAQLAMSSVELDADTDIEFSNNLASGGNPGSLTLKAGRSIIIDTGVSIAVGGGFTATANDSGASAGDRDAGTAEFTMNTGSSITAAGAISITMNTAGGVGPAGVLQLNGSVSGDGVDLHGPVTLTGNTTVLGNGGAVTFESTVDGPFNLTVNSGGATEEFKGNVGGTAALASLNIVASGGTTILDGTLVSTTAGQTYGDALTLTGGALLLEDTTGTISFLQSVTGANTALTVAGLDDEIQGDTLALKSLTTGVLGTLSSATISSGLITTTAGQTYQFAVTLTGANTRLADSAGSIAFFQTLTGPTTNLTLAGAGGNVIDGTTDLNSLDAKGAGGTVIGGGLVSTTGGQTYEDAVTATFADLTFASSNGVITFDSSLTGPSTAVVVQGDGDVFDGPVSVYSLKAGGSGVTMLGAGVGSISTTNGQTYLDAVTLSGPSLSLLDSGMGVITLDQSVTGAGTALTIDSQSGIVLAANIATASLKVQGAGGATFNGTLISTTSGQTYEDALTLTQSHVTLADNAGVINLTADVTGPTTALVVDGAGGNVISGASDALASLDVKGAGGTTLGQLGAATAISTTAGQTYEDAVTLLGNTDTLTDNVGRITFETNVGGLSTALIVDAAGGNVFAGTHSTVMVASLSVAGAAGTTLAGALVSTTSGQTYEDAVILTGASITFSDSGGTSVFQQTLTGPHTAVSFTGNGVKTIDEETLTFTSLSTAGGSLTIGQASGAVLVTTTGNQDYNGAVKLPGTSAMFTASTGAVVFAGNVTGTATLLTVRGAGGNTFDGLVSVKGLVSDAATLLAGATVTTSGAQTYVDAVTLNGPQVRLSTVSGPVTFDSSIAPASSPATVLEVAGAGGNIFDGPVSTEVLLTAGAGVTTIKDGVTTTEGQEYENPVDLVDSTLTDDTQISFGSSITGSGKVISQGSIKTSGGSGFTNPAIQFRSNNPSDASEFGSNFSLLSGSRNLDLDTLIAQEVAFQTTGPQFYLTILSDGDRADLALLGVNLQSDDQAQSEVSGSAVEGFVVEDWPQVHHPGPRDQWVNPNLLNPLRLQRAIDQANLVWGEHGARRRQLTRLLAAAISDYFAPTSPPPTRAAPAAFVQFVFSTPSQRSLADKLLAMRRLADDVGRLGLTPAQATLANQTWTADLTPPDQRLTDFFGQPDPHWLLNVLGEMLPPR